MDVLAFLLKDNAFPRAFRYGIEGVAECLKFIGGAEVVQGIIARIEAQLYLADITRLADNEGLHEFLGRFANSPGRTPYDHQCDLF